MTFNSLSLTASWTSRNKASTTLVGLKRAQMIPNAVTERPRSHKRRHGPHRFDSTDTPEMLLRRHTPPGHLTRIKCMYFSTVYDCKFGNFPAKSTMYIWSWPSLIACHTNSAVCPFLLLLYEPSNVSM